MNEKSKNPVLIGSLLTVVSVMIWSGNYVIASGIGDAIQPVSLNFLRWSMAVIAALPFGLKPLIEQRQLVLKNWKVMVPISIFGVTIFNTLVYMAGRTTSALNLSLISLAIPVTIIALSAIFDKEPVTWRKVVGLLIVITGVILLLTKGQPLQILTIEFASGDLLMLLGAFSFGMYSFLLKRKPQGLHPQAFQLSTFIIGLIFLAPFFIVQRVTSAPLVFNWELILPILYTGVFASLVAFSLWSIAISLIGPTNTSIMSNFMPLFSGIAGWLFLNQPITVMHLVSGLTILAGVIVANENIKFGKGESAARTQGLSSPG